MTREELWTEKRNCATRLTEIMDRATAEGRARTAEEDAQYDASAERIVAIERQMAQEDEHATRMRSLEEPVRRSAAHPAHDRDADAGGEAGVRSKEYARSFRRYLQTGQNSLRPEDRERLEAGADAALVENRALSSLIGSSGGYLIPPSFLDQITETKKWYGGAFQVGAQEITTATGEDIMWPTNDDTGNTGELLNENGSVGTADVTFGQKKLSAYIFSSKMVKAPIFLLQDSAFDVESFLSRKFGQRLGRAENYYLTVGTGANQPQGMVTGATSGVTSAAATAITYNETIDLEHSVDKAYRDGQRSKFMWHDLTFKLVRKLQDADGRPLWQPSLEKAAPSLFNGYEYVINNDMAQATATNVAILFGDFFSYYIIRRVTGLLAIRLDELYIGNLQKAFFAVERLDGGVQDSAAVRALTMHA